MIDNVTSPVVSIIMCTYNGASYIAETINSVRDQTYINWELIIVDDGSDDKTCDMVAAIPDQRIELHKAGRVGVNGRLKNMALNKASGGLIAFIDHDDLWAPTKLEKQVAALQQNPDAGFCLVGGYNFKKQDEPISFFYRQRTGEKVENVMYSFFRSEIPAWTQALLVRKECIEKAGTFEEAGPFTDPEFMINLSCHFKAVVLYEPLFYHRVHDNSYSSKNWVEGHDHGIEIINKYKTKKLLPLSLASDALFRSHINFGEKYLARRQSGNAIQHFYKAWKNKPGSIVPFKKTVRALLRFLKKEAHHFFCHFIH